MIPPTEGRPLSRKMKDDASKTLGKWTQGFLKNIICHAMQCILYKIYFCKVFHMYYKLICILYALLCGQNFILVKKWVLHTAMGDLLLPRAAPLLPHATRWEAPAAVTPLLLPHVCRKWEAPTATAPILLPPPTQMTRWRCGWRLLLLLYAYRWLFLLLSHAWHLLLL
jgi:hypothetical protein